ncbi:hypothetical protein [Alkaliphilus sp. B6464]|uniref:hypothetical protein n=1 Tax=Alkaliphilus sp. B6464 TaxID=2731219 RepID=UPI001BAB635C|nr:hypothetical protein [Alkaliphilus sp. B6464]QUH21211.1 hypothetical protein HYG84_15850 [Alkaliphilus sp. B6464]
MDIIKILKGIACGVIYISSFFWTMVLTLTYSNFDFWIILLVAILTNIIIGFLMSSNTHRNSFYKWLISLPAGTITFLIYRETNFIYYWLNRIHPEYGKLSAGGNFAMFFYMIFYLLSFFISVIISVCITGEKIKKYKKIDSSKL